MGFGYLQGGLKGFGVVSRYVMRVSVCLRGISEVSRGFKGFQGGSSGFLGSFEMFLGISLEFRVVYRCLKGFLGY